ncbi:MAG: exodeoxyribonuclease VII large subunit, partial [Opitutales bacterium]
MDLIPEPPDRALTVGALTQRIKQLLERSMGEVWVLGELSNLRRQASGHCYFTLKDAEAQLS